MGTLDPSRDNIPKENAISVAEGMAQPFKVSYYQSLYKHTLRLALTFLQQPLI